MNAKWMCSKLSNGKVRNSHLVKSCFDRRQNERMLPKMVWTCAELIFECTSEEG